MTRERKRKAAFSAALLTLSLSTAGAALAAGDAPMQVAVLDDVFFGRLREEPKPQAGLDPALLRQAIEASRKGDVAGADRLKAQLKDATASALVDWVGIRVGAATGFERIAGFLREHPDWPVSSLLRRRAEEALLANRRPPPVVRAFFAAQRPISAQGKLALALAFRADGLDEDAADLVRDLWRTETLSKEFEAKVLDAFPGVLTTADHRFRMERLLFKENWTSAARAAARAGKDYVALAKARRIVADKEGGAEKALDAVPPALRGDTSYLFTKAQHLRRKDKALEAAKVIANVPRDSSVLADGDEWWVERRLIARKLLDDGDAQAAYGVVRDHAADSPAKKIEAEFHAGWIALRFLKDPGTADRHFAEADGIAETPISVARTAYWRGRAAEAAGKPSESRRQYERAAAHPITFYGQLAQEKLGVGALALRVSSTEPERRPRFEAMTPVKALRHLYAAGAKDLALALTADLAQRLKEACDLNALAELAADQRDARALLTAGKTAVQRGYPLDLHAYPTIGIPAFEPAVAKVEKAMIFAIARQESAFDPKAQSHAGARGLMQLMPATAKRTAQRFALGYDLDRLTEDPSYNARLGSAHLAELMQDWKGSHILAFASYNAGGPNVKKWIDAYGDPRQPSVDLIDWIERIPFSETRNYVQRVMENFNVYRRRFDERAPGVIEADASR